MGKDEFSVTAISSNCNGCNLLEILDLFVNVRKGKHIGTVSHSIKCMHTELQIFIMNYGNL